MIFTYRGVNFPRAIALGLAGGFAVITWGNWDRAQLARLPHPDKTPPTGKSAAARLATHVTTLAGKLGERNIFNPRALELAAGYIEGEFNRAGYAPRALRYTVELEGTKPTEMRDIEVVAPADRPDAPVLVVGAHYDSAPGTPGADDNASGTAAVLELARRFHGKTGKVELRFVAFSTEEPPFFGTAQMGSAHYAAALAREGREVAGMISLEMLGYYSGEPRSQTYPPVLGLFYPSRGDYLGFVSNLSSWRFLRRLKRGYRAPKGTPAIASALPQWLSVITLSDHLWFWRRGWPAAMVTDTAFLRNPHYHEPGDRPPQLDYERFADVVDGLEQSLLAFSR